MNSKLILTASAAALALSVGAARAEAAPNLYGVQTLASLRNCRGVADTQECSGGRLLRPFATDGGLFSKTAKSGFTEDRAIPQSGSFGEGRGELNGAGINLPTLHAVSSSASSDSRVNGSALAFTTFSYDGPSGAAFSLKSTLNVDDSLPSPANPLLPGGAFVSFYVGIFEAAIFHLDYVNFATKDIAAGPAYGCGTRGLLGFGYATPAAAGGSFSVSVTTDSCSGKPITLLKGQQVVAYTNLSMFTNRGGYLDALHTMRTELDPALGQEAIASLEANLVSGVPEPATWAMMIGGFGMLGAATRRRRTQISHA